jgi:hypothetical protein
MDPITITSLFNLGQSALERLFPDPQARAEEMRKLEELRQAGDVAQLNAKVQLMLAQIDVNKAEAKSGSLFVAGWRPAVGWVGAVGLACAFIPKALAVTVLWSIQAWVMMDGCFDSNTCDISTYVLPPFPELGLTDLIGILGGILGIGGMRSFDKVKKTDTRKIG